MSAEPLTGGCACGAVRYRLAGPLVDPGYCHCKTCQAVSGAPVLAYASVGRDDFSLLKGDLQIYRSSDFGTRGFCARCGTQLTMQVDQQPETIDVTLASLDQPEAVAPAFHIWTRSRIAWFDTADSMPRYAGSRPGTAGTSA